MKSPRRVKEVQSLTGRIAALTRFVSKATDKCQPFFKALKKTDGFEWTDECEKPTKELPSACRARHSTRRARAESHRALSRFRDGKIHV